MTCNGLLWIWECKSVTNLLVLATFTHDSESQFCPVIDNNDHTELADFTQWPNTVCKTACLDTG